MFGTICCSVQDALYRHVWICDKWRCLGQGLCLTTVGHCSFCCRLPALAAAYGSVDFLLKLQTMVNAYFHSLQINSGYIAVYVTSIQFCHCITWAEVSAGMSSESDQYLCSLHCISAYVAHVISSDNGGNVAPVAELNIQLQGR